MASQEEISARLKALKQRYCDKLPERLAECVALGEKLGQAWDQAAAEDLRDRAHKLAGTAGSFGYDEVTDLCRKIDETLERVLAAGRLGIAEKKIIADCLAALPAAARG